MKKLSLIIALFSLSFCLIAQQPGGPLGGPAQQNGGWPGSYQGSINGTNSVLTISLTGSQLTGKIDAAGYIYNLSGTVNGLSCTGKLMDKITGGSMEFKAGLNGNILDLILLVPNEYGQLTEWPLQYSRGAGNQSMGGANQSMGGSPQAQAEQANEQRDPYLLGGWRHTETFSSGEFGTVSEWYMTIRRDGTYTYGDGEIAGGSDDYSFYSEGGSGNETGRWKTENSIIYINEGTGWQAYAKYYIEGNSMMFTFGDGSKQLWEKYR